MTDPAKDAALRTLVAMVGREWVRGEALEHAAREMAAPIRALHRKSAIYAHIDDCDNQDDEHERLWHFETADGEWVCEALPVLGWTCEECAEVASAADDLPEWPCATARIVYPSEELETPNA